MQSNVATILYLVPDLLTTSAGCPIPFESCWNHYNVVLVVNVRKLQTKSKPTHFKPTALCDIYSYDHSLIYTSKHLFENVRLYGCHTILFLKVP